MGGSGGGCAGSAAPAVAWAGQALIVRKEVSYREELTHTTLSQNWRQKPQFAGFSQCKLSCQYLTLKKVSSITLPC